MSRKALVCLVLLLSSISPGARADEATDVKALVEKAAKIFKEEGLCDYGLRVVNAGAGPLRRKRELYVFAFDGNGVILAHPVNRKMVGKSQRGVKDAKGKLFGDEFIRVAKEEGSGWVEYWWLRHGEQEPTLKRAYIMKVPGEDVFLASGYYVK